MTNAQVTFWDVGQGDCSTIEIPGQGLTVIDCGPKGSPLVDWVRDRRYGIHTVVLTHNDADHAGALPALLDAAPAISNVILLRDRAPENKVQRNLFRRLDEGQRMGRWRVRRLERDLTIWTTPDGKRRLHAVYPGMLENESASNPNSTSGIVCLSTNRGTEFIWPGDAPLAALAENCAEMRPEVLVGPHHGAASNYKRRVETSAQIERVGQKRTFISVGTHNRYSHPRPKYIRLLEHHGSQVCCSELTVLCDRAHVMQRGAPILESAGFLGMPAARSGIACRGALRYQLQQEVWIRDGLDAAHLQKIQKLRRAQCLKGRAQYTKTTDC
jgi:competence protein ComEC